MFIRQRSEGGGAKEIIVPADGEYFYLVSEYKSIIKVDHENMVIIRETDPDMRAGRLSVIKNLFGGALSD